ncbi:MAG: tetratricopeptide repeat protein [Xanthobacteraceae bacterium]|jgi:tetratricopeptide (TPR) repeat protein
MRKTSLLTAVVLAAAISGAPQLAAAMGAASPSGSDTQQSSKPSGKTDTKTGTKKNKKDKSSSVKDFIDGYHVAYALIYDKEDYQGGITTLRGLGHDDNADVATLLGYASRKLGRYDDAKYWYDKALAADPKHALTWSYYGMWHAEQGNLLKAKDDLEQVRLICGTECKEFVALKEVIDGTRTY